MTYGRAGDLTGVNLAHTPTPESETHLSKCPVCSSPVYRSIPALLDPFIAKRCGFPIDRPTFSNFCASCEYIFRTPLLNTEELSRLYAGYRGQDYNNSRLSIEPGYQQVIDALDDREGTYWTSRQVYYDNFLSDLRSMTGTVVDFGGGDGFFSRYCFPEADIHVVEEAFEREGGNLPDLLGRTRLLFCAQVFEHLTQPTATLAALASHMPVGSRVWIDVPNDHSRSPDATFTEYERATSDGTVAWTSSVVIFHEHVGNFSAKSLRVMLARAGVDPKLVVQTPVTLGILGTRI